MQNADAPPDAYLTDAQLADLLRVTTRTTLRWRREGDGPPFIRVGERFIRYSRTDVESWLAARRFRSLAAEAAP